MWRCLQQPFIVPNSRSAAFLLRNRRRGSSSSLVGAALVTRSSNGRRRLTRSDSCGIRTTKAPSRYLREELTPSAHLNIQLPLSVSPTTRTIRWSSVAPHPDDSDDDEVDVQAEMHFDLKRRWMRKIDLDTVHEVHAILDTIRETDHNSFSDDSRCSRTIQSYQRMLKRKLFLMSAQDRMRLQHQKSQGNMDTTTTTSYSDEELAPWEQFLKEADRINPLRHGGQRAPQGMHASLSLLRVLSNRDWRRIDRFVEGGNDVVEESEELETCDREHVDGDAPTQEETKLDIVTDAAGEDDKNDTAGLESASSASHDRSLESSMELIHSVLNLAAMGEITLDTQDYNMLLCRAAISLDLAPDDCNRLVMKIRSFMTNKTYLLPDAVTSEILIHFVTERMGTPNVGVGFVNELLKESMLRSPDSYRVAFRLCERLNKVQLAVELWECFLENEASVFILPFDVLESLLRTMRSNNLQDEAIELLRHTLEYNRQLRNPRLDRIFECATRWPTRSKGGGTEDNTKVLEATLGMLCEEETYMPSAEIWRDLVLAASRFSEENLPRTQIARGALKELFSRFEAYNVDGRLMKVGLDTCKNSNDAWLAVDLFARRLGDVAFQLGKLRQGRLGDTGGFFPSVKHETFQERTQSISKLVALGESSVHAGHVPIPVIEIEGSHSSGAGVVLMDESTIEDYTTGEKTTIVGRTDELENRRTSSGEFPIDEATQEKRYSIRVSSQEVLMVMKICVECQETDAIESILSLLEQYEDAFHSSLFPLVCSIAIKSFVEHNKVDLAEKTLRRLETKDYAPR